VAVNLAHALMARGRVGLVDADPKLPNARFYLGLPSWHYLSPVTWEGRPAPNTVSDSGVVVLDRASGSQPAEDIIGNGDVVYVDIASGGRVPLHYMVVDLPVERAAWIGPIADRVGLFVVVATPGVCGFHEAYNVLATLRGEVGLQGAALVVNMIEKTGSAADFHAKMEVAAECLLSMKMDFLGGIAYQANLGSEQRERGAIVRSRPDAVAALQLREISSKALAVGWPS
jgi:MinD-like ATPase involved in chromosome partitioning or flagellar assembly